LNFDSRSEPFVGYMSVDQFERETTRLAQSAANEANRLDQTSKLRQLCWLWWNEGGFPNKRKEAGQPMMPKWQWRYQAELTAAALFNSVRDERVRPAVARVETSF
jgi:hypothetical protein